MQVTLKTVDNIVVKIDIDPDENVRNIIKKLKDCWGEEKTYKLIYAGKVLRESSLLSDYGVSGTLPIIVLVTGSKNVAKKTNAKNSNSELQQTFKHDEADKQRSRRLALARQREEIRKPPTLTLTDAEFSSSLQLIMRCNYLFQEDVTKISRDDMISAVNKRFTGDPPDPEEDQAKDLILSKLDEVLDAGPNAAQFNSFLALGFCWCQTYHPEGDL